jgi:hypothetical protein
MMKVMRTLVLLASFTGTASFMCARLAPQRAPMAIVATMPEEDVKKQSVDVSAASADIKKFLETEEVQTAGKIAGDVGMGAGKLLFSAGMAASQLLWKERGTIISAGKTAGGAIWENRDVVLNPVADVTKMTSETLKREYDKMDAVRIAKEKEEAEKARIEAMKSMPQKLTEAALLEAEAFVLNLETSTLEAIENKKNAITGSITGALQGQVNGAEQELQAARLKRHQLQAEVQGTQERMMAQMETFLRDANMALAPKPKATNKRAAPSKKKTMKPKKAVQKKATKKPVQSKAEPMFAFLNPGLKKKAPAPPPKKKFGLF